MGSLHTSYYHHHHSHPHLLLLCVLTAPGLLAGARHQSDVVSPFGGGGGGGGVGAPSAQPEPPPPQPGAAAQFLDAHNAARAAVGAGLAPLRWSPQLAAAAAAAVKRQRETSPGCGFADLGATPYGANQAWTAYPATPAEAVASWVAAGAHYDRGSDACGAGFDCGTYTQVVWRRTLAVGCAQATCPRRQAGATLTLCLYDPHGNVRGQPPY